MVSGFLIKWLLTDDVAGLIRASEWPPLLFLSVQNIGQFMVLALS